MKNTNTDTYKGFHVDSKLVNAIDNVDLRRLSVYIQRSPASTAGWYCTIRRVRIIRQYYVRAYLFMRLQYIYTSF